MIPPLDELTTLGEPYELLDLVPESSIELVPTGWTLGKGLIHPRDGRSPHEIPILRLTVAPADKPTLPHWWDVTAKTLIAGLLGFLKAPRATKRRYIITKHGSAATARFTLDTHPL